jgi:hypothetical protein
MPLTTDTLNALATHLGTLCAHLSLHSGDPGATGANATSAGRQPATWSAAANGDLILSAAKNFTGGAAGGAVTWVGLWSAATGGTFRGAFPLTGDQTFNAAGEYTLNSLVIDGSST